MKDVCAGGVSNYERKKADLLSANRWKSNFISLWKKFGTFQTINGVECFELYRISDAGEGQERMSKHLQQPDLWEKTQHDEIKNVKLFFNLNKLIKIDTNAITAWRDAKKEEIDGALFDTLKYEISNKEVLSHGFYLSEYDVDGNVTSQTLVTDEFYVKLSGWVAEKKRGELDENSNWNGSFVYDEAVTVADVEAMIDSVSTYTQDMSSWVLVFKVDEVEEDMQIFLSEQGVGTDILDELVVKHGLEIANTPDRYYLPLDAAKKMNGYVFIELVTKTLDFRIKKKGGFWRTLKKFIKLILAVVALYFQQYWLAASLMVGFVADLTGSKVLKVVSQLLGIMQGDFTSLANFGVSEALELLLNIYMVYVTLEYNPESGTEIEEESDKTQEMFYQAPYEAYESIYCYEGLITVKHDSMF